MNAKNTSIYKFIPPAVLIVLCIFIIGRAASPDSYKTCSYSKTGECLGTVVTVTLYDTEDRPMTEDELKEVAGKLFTEADRLELIFSAKLSDSELGRLNATPAGTPVSVSEELFELFGLSMEYCEKSEGAFDISIGRLIRLWNIGSDTPYLPSAKEVSPYIGLSGWKGISLDASAHTITYDSEEISVDFGAIAKGYVGDRLKQMALDNGVSCGMLYLGGNIVTIGERYTGGDWTIAITDPLSPDSYAATLKVTDMSVVTSGNYERYFILDGVRYHHILNPLTGFPADNGIISVTVIGEVSARCDALSTALYVMGQEKGLALIENLEGYEAVFISDTGDITASSGMDKYALRMELTYER